MPAGPRTDRGWAITVTVSSDSETVTVPFELTPWHRRPRLAGPLTLRLSFSARLGRAAANLTVGESIGEPDSGAGFQASVLTVRSCSAHQPAVRDTAAGQQLSGLVAGELGDRCRRIILASSVPVPLAQTR